MQFAYSNFSSCFEKLSLRLFSNSLKVISFHLSIYKLNIKEQVERPIKNSRFEIMGIVEILSILVIIKLNFNQTLMGNDFYSIDAIINTVTPQEHVDNILRNCDSLQILDDNYLALLNFFNYCLFLHTKTISKQFNS